MRMADTASYFPECQNKEPTMKSRTSTPTQASTHFPFSDLKYTPLMTKQTPTSSPLASPSSPSQFFFNLSLSMRMIS